MADNYTFQGGVARAKDVNSKYLPYVFVATAIPTIASWQKLTIGTTAGTLASFCSGAALPSNATEALVQAGKTNTGKIYWRDDGTNADAAAVSGFELAAGESALFVPLAGITLDADAASQILFVSFRRYDQ